MVLYMRFCYMFAFAGNCEMSAAGPVVEFEQQKLRTFFHNAADVDCI